MSFLVGELFVSISGMIGTILNLIFYALKRIIILKIIVKEKNGRIT